MAETARLACWEALEKAAKDMLATMEQAARCDQWTDADIERWDDLHTMLTNRPRLSLVERDRMAGYFESMEPQKNPSRVRDQSGQAVGDRINDKDCSD